MSESTPWRVLECDFQLRHSQCAVPRAPTDYHPLLDAVDGDRKGAGDATAAVSIGSSAGAGPAAPPTQPQPQPAVAAAAADADDDDPLSMLMGDSDDPLSSPMQPHEILLSDAGGSGSGSGSAGSSESAVLRAPGQAMLDLWEVEKQRILDEFTLIGKIKVSAGLLDSESANAVSEQPRKVNMDKGKQRLEEFEDAKGEEDMREMSQKQYVASINKLHQEIAAAWHRDSRVVALRRTIQCCNMMAQPTVPSFYPSVFVLVTDILDSFGRLVYERLQSRAAEETGFSVAKGVWKTTFSASEVPENARETARNWFFKIACVRELAPRLLVELALLRCRCFVADGEEVSTLQRICGGIRGVGDVLVATYMRAYLLRVGSQCLASSAFVTVAEQCFDDFVTTFDFFKNGKLEAAARAADMTPDEYTRLFGPAVNWIGRYVSTGATKDKYARLLGQFRDNCGVTVALRPLVLGFAPELVAAFATRIVSMAKEAEPLGCSKCDVFVTLGDKLLEYPPPQEQKLSVLNEVWKVVRVEPDLGSYARCVVSFIRLMLRHYTEREVLILLKDLAKHITANRDTIDSVLPQLESVVDAIVNYSRGTFGTILSSEYFMTVLDAFKSDRKTQLCKQLLATFADRKGTTGDPVLIHTVFDIARNLHDSVDSLSFDDERRQISQLICRFVDKIDFGRDLEQQLNVYVDCRAAFSNLDSVIERLVVAVLRLAMRGHSLVKGRHSRKTAAFVKACLAYVHISIPSIDDIMRRLELFQLAGQVALINQCLPQADACLKQAVAMIPDVPAFTESQSQRSPTEPRLVTFVASFASTLVVAPGHPEHGPFYLAKGLINALQRYSWEEGSTGKARALLALLPYFHAQAQRSLPYHVDKLESNDALYGGHPEFLRELETYVSNIIETVLEEISAGVQSSREKKTPWPEGARLALELFEQLVTLIDVGQKRPATVATQLLAIVADLQQPKPDPQVRAWLRCTARHLDALAARGYPRGVTPEALADAEATQLVYRKLAQSIAAAS